MITPPYITNSRYYVTPPPFAQRTQETVPSPSISVKRVKHIIKYLDASKSSGPDDIPVIVFKKLSPRLSPVLSKLFSKCPVNFLLLGKLPLLSLFQRKDVTLCNHPAMSNQSSPNSRQSLRSADQQDPGPVSRKSRAFV